MKKPQSSSQSQLSSQPSLVLLFILFQEAHKMVHEANTKQANAEKQLKEALGKVMIPVRHHPSSDPWSN